ncbi:LysR family transcriptional regulator [Ramlibacter sp.]|uniref:LysR family transcriptional regulator n=1 Tax=Ramlibacter sp. TaxID=1917967 RepID=UPI003D0CCF17
MSRASDRGRLARVDLTMVATLKAIFDTGKVSKAADALGVTQPSVSQNLKRLRAYFNDELFVRSGNSLQPTARALALQPLVARLMRDIDLISQPPDDFDPAAANREFIICMSEAAEYVVLPRLAALFAEQAPGCSIRGTRLPQPQLMQALEKGEVDLAAGILLGADRSLRQTRLIDFGFVCLVSANGRWAKTPLTRQAYTESRHVLVQRITDADDPIGERLRVKGIHRSIALTVANDFVAARVVADTDLICTVTVPVGRQLAALFPVGLQPPPVELGRMSSRLIWHERFQRDASHMWLRKIVENVYRDALA